MNGDESQTPSTGIPEEILKLIASVRNKRARFVLDQIALKGSVSTEEISHAGYDHPPRAAQDVRDLGFPLITDKFKHSNGRSIAAYRLDIEKLQNWNMQGRRALSKKFRDEILDEAQRRCRICSSTLNLQADHRIPYQIAGESVSGGHQDFQALCGSCNRKKSWACEHCPNFLTEKKRSICEGCYWSGNDSYTHIATIEERRAELVWIGDREVAMADELRREAKDGGTTLPEHIKAILDR